MRQTLTLAFVIVFCLGLFPVMDFAMANDDELNEQRKSMLGDGIRFSSDKPSFRGRNLDTKSSKKIRKALDKDPLAGGAVTGQINEMISGGSSTRYRYNYSQYYPQRPMFKDTDIVLCEKCKARAVLDACTACEDHGFMDLCDKCKARSILNACDKCQDGIRTSKAAADKETDAAKADPKPAKKSK